jgi:hypothetical protein
MHQNLPNQIASQLLRRLLIKRPIQLPHTHAADFLPYPRIRRESYVGSSHGTGIAVILSGAKDLEIGSCSALEILRFAALKMLNPAHGSPSPGNPQRLSPSA